MADYFGMMERRLRTKVKKKYGMPFNTVYGKLVELGRAKIRAKQYEKGVKDGDGSMLEWLGKQYLGQAEKVEQLNISVEEQKANLKKAKKELKNAIGDLNIRGKSKFQLTA